ncbi:TetR/AcrR family transcriptional regulator [Pseudomonas sp. Gutcm_11s]|uniref:TetR/AcrR family transcriptional regulator n=1 Tax=Pseudomonas sp. Gutcm_11s TaxID=3026088 RepID=UPI00235F1DFA|nr:TetR/AcrR family transcriptional regulator [Pseudomonas sp. Gutcm_11s]MDD0841769.1 TetR/AcrR family transcriptional regulator [Pseudomonas sp. Gutcm_11s]
MPAAPTPAPSAAKPAGRIRQKNEKAIIAAAEVEFARHGYKGTSMNSIAQAVGLPKANLHYYFSSKQGLYIAVLQNILCQWEKALDGMTVNDDPAEALSRYIRSKIEFSRTQPLASRIFAMEVISGGQQLAAHYSQGSRDWFHGRTAVIQGWIDAGKMDPVDPAHLIFMLWGSTQHYADFASQIALYSGKSSLKKADYEEATDNLVRIILKGCGIKLPA